MPISMKAKDERNRMASSIASASAAIEMRAIEFAGQRVMPRQPHQLLVAGMAFVVARTMPCARTGLPSAPANQHAGFLDPEHGRG